MAFGLGSGCSFISPDNGIISDWFKQEIRKGVEIIVAAPGLLLGFAFNLVLALLVCGSIG